MSQVADIRVYKKNLRSRYRSEREKMTMVVKSKLDSDIRKRFIRLNQYDSAKLVLTYVSTPIEVDTRELIVQMLNDGKEVAVPRCITETREMNFYKIKTLEGLNKGTFGVDEPEAEQENLVTDFADSVCIVPALCFDNMGYRLGYGFGYYDRFLSSYKGVKVGICYSSGVRNHLVHGRYDFPVDFLVTEKYIRTTMLKNNTKKW